MGVPVPGLPARLPNVGVPARQRDLPHPPELSVMGQSVPGLPAGVPAQRDLPQMPGLPVDGLPVPGLVRTPHLSVSGLPVPGLPTQQRDLPQTPELPVPSRSQDPHLPVPALPEAGVPVSGLLSGVSIAGRHVVIPRQLDLPRPPALPVSGDVVAPLSAVSQGAVPQGNSGGFGRVDMLFDPTEVTAIIPVFPPFSGVDNMTDITTVLPVIPAAPGVSEVPVPGGSSLDSTRAALANLFSTHPIV
jgi:hypothetical protein